MAAFRGSYPQAPPPFSAKKIDGDRAYDLARNNEPVLLRPADVTVHVLDVLEWDASILRLRLVCSAGFYVRALAQAIGERLGTGAHLANLVRTRSGEFTLAGAVSIADLDRHPAETAKRVIRLEQLVPWLPALRLTTEGARLAAKGGFLTSRHVTGGEPLPTSGRVRLLHPDGHLVAIAERRSQAGNGPGLLHPGVVLE